MLNGLKIGLVVGCVIILGIISYYLKPLRRRTREPLVTSIKHLAIIPDGNRRWAKKSGLQAWFGHKKGVDPLKMTMQFCCQHNIPYLTVYTWSQENFKRSHEEQSYLFEVLAQELAATEINELIKNNICVRFVGDRTLFPAQLVPIIEDIEAKTKDNNRLTVNLLFCYGGKQEILQALNRIVHDAQHGKLQEEISDEFFKKYLWLTDIPDPDLVIRTGKREALSNFLTYHATYSELYFIDCLWPEFTEDHLTVLINKFEQARRNFGA